MKQRWDKFTAEMAELVNMTNELNEGITDVRISKAVKKVVNQLTKVVNLTNEIDHLVDPIAAMDVKLPFEGSEFADMWKMYKEYMIESHNYSIRSRQEGILLGRLKRLSENSQQRATMMLELFISNGYKSIFKPSEKQLTGEEPTKVEDQQPTMSLEKKAKL
jgi:hypothetical protein